MTDVTKDTSEIVQVDLIVQGMNWVQSIYLSILYYTILWIPLFTHAIFKNHVENISCK